MNILENCWLVFLAASFATSVTVGIKAARRVRAKEFLRTHFYRRRTRLFWSDLSSFERALILPGLLAFFITFVVRLVRDFLSHR